MLARFFRFSFVVLPMYLCVPIFSAEIGCVIVYLKLLHRETGIDNALTFRLTFVLTCCLMFRLISCADMHSDIFQLTWKSREKEEEEKEEEKEWI